MIHTSKSYWDKARGSQINRTRINTPHQITPLGIHVGEDISKRGQTHVQILLRAELAHTSVKAAARVHACIDRRFFIPSMHPILAYVIVLI
jgi:hypothetical protein